MGSKRHHGMTGKTKKKKQRRVMAAECSSKDGDGGRGYSVQKYVNTKLKRKIIMAKSKAPLRDRIHSR